MFGLPLVLVGSLVVAVAVASAASGATPLRRQRLVRGISSVIDLALLALAMRIFAEIADQGDLFAYALIALLVTLPLAAVLVPSLRGSPRSGRHRVPRRETGLFSVATIGSAMLFGVLAVSATGAQPIHVRGIGAVTGDTLLVATGKDQVSRIQLIGIRAPRSRACFASQARKALNVAVAGRRLTLRSDRSAKRRSYVFRGTTDIGERLVSSGFVRVDPHQHFYRAARYRRLEERARRRGTGLWSACVMHARADLAITQLESADPVRLGSDLTYTLKVTNRGPYGVGNVVVVDELPKSLDPNHRAMQINFVGSCSLETATWRVECSINRLPVQGSAEIAITVRPASVGLLTNHATVAASTEDNVRSNNSAVEQTTVID